MNTSIFESVVKSTKKGFTLIELLVVVTIIWILAAVSYNATQSGTDKTKIVAANETLQSLVKWIDDYYKDNQKLPIEVKTVDGSKFDSITYGAANVGYLSTNWSFAKYLDSKIKTDANWIVTIDGNKVFYATDSNSAGNGSFYAVWITSKNDAGDSIMRVETNVNTIKKSVMTLLWVADRGAVLTANDSNVRGKIITAANQVDDTTLLIKTSFPLVAADVAVGPSSPIQIGASRATAVTKADGSAFADGVTSIKATIWNTVDSQLVITGGTTNFPAVYISK